MNAIAFSTFCRTLARAGGFRLLSCVAAGCVAFALSRSAAAQNAAPSPAQPKLTAKQLLSDSISDIGPKHAEVDDAIGKFTLGDAAGALAHLKNVKANVKELPPPEILMAKLWFQLGRNPQAGRAWLEKAVAADATDPESFSLLGEVALAEGRSTDAEVLYAKALELCDKYTANAKRKLNLQRKALQGSVIVAQRRQNWPAAKALVDRWLKIDAESAAAQTSNGQVLFYLNKPAEAYKAFQDADQIQLKSVTKADKTPSPMAELNMAQLYQQRDNDDKRTTDFINLAVKNHAKDFGVRFTAATIAMRSNLLDIALSNAETAVKMDETSLQAKLLRGYVARLRGDTKTAERYFELAHLQSPSSFEASNNLALLLSDQDDEAKQNRALEFAVMNVQRFPVNGDSPARFDALSTFGWVQFQRGNVAAAEQALQQVVNANALTSDSKYYIAKLLHTKQKRDDAIRVLESALESDTPFVNRKPAEEMLATLKRKPAASGPTRTPAKTPAGAGGGPAR